MLNQGISKEILDDMEAQPEKNTSNSFSSIHKLTVLVNGNLVLPKKCSANVLAGYALI